MDERRHKLIPGLMLTAMGVLFLIILNTRSGSPFILAAIGVSFLIAFVWTREDHLLVPGSLLTGLGLGIAMRVRWWPLALVAAGSVMLWTERRGAEASGGRG